MNSVEIRIDNYPSLYVDLGSLDEHALNLYFATPLRHIPHEPGLTELFGRLILPDDVVFDVGANLGMHTLTFSLMAKEVFAFEPNPSLLPNLRKTVSAIPNAKLVETCLTDHDGTVEFHISEWDHMLGSMANWTGQPTQDLAIPARSIDSLIAEGVLPKPQVMKVDVEGAELLVFTGAEKLFSSPDAPRTIVFEELNTASRRLGIEDGAAADFLRMKGYSLYLIDGAKLVEFPETRPPAANLVAARGKPFIN